MAQFKACFPGRVELLVGEKFEYISIFFKNVENAQYYSGSTLKVCC
jgi:hypothetical protein